MSYLFTSESVSEGHPDKIADQISDAVLDATLEQDPESRVAIETLVSPRLVVLAGEVTTKAEIDRKAIARAVLRDIGYTRENGHVDADRIFDAESCLVIDLVGKQSPDIAQGVDDGGAGDQGMMFGYACSETDERMPLPIMYAHGLVRGLADIRKEGVGMPYLRPDAKSQVTIEYEDDRKSPRRVHTLVVSTQHDEGVSNEDIKRDIREHLLLRLIDQKVIDPQLLDLDGETRLLVNPTGQFVKGGPDADVGLTGRKIIVDTYGGKGAHGGGAFSGKDATKVDRSAAYAARHVAKNIVAAGLAQEVEVQIAYAIGEPKPVSIDVNTGGTGIVSDDRVLVCAIKKVFDMRPRAIIGRLGLHRPLFRRTAAYGHFGREGFPWEQVDHVDALKKAVG